jgi:hypothetical protein
LDIVYQSRHISFLSCPLQIWRIRCVQQRAASPHHLFFDEIDAIAAVE